MMVAGRIAQIMGSMTEDQIAQQQELISAFGLPVKVPAEMTNESIIAATTSDKKAVGGRSRYVLPVTIGRMNDFGGKYATEVQSSIVEEALEKTRG
jgi:3-dehydroquinate synthetase